MFLNFSAHTGCKIQKEKHSLATKITSGKSPAMVTYLIVTYRLIDNQPSNSPTVVGIHSVTPWLFIHIYSLKHFP